MNADSSGLHLAKSTEEDAARARPASRRRPSAGETKRSVGKSAESAPPAKRSAAKRTVRSAANKPRPASAAPAKQSASRPAAAKEPVAKQPPSRRPAAKSQPAQPGPVQQAKVAAAVAAEGEDPLARLDRGRGGSLLRNTPTWLVSLVVHLVGILIFAQITFSLVDPNDGTFIDAAPVSHAEEAPLEELVMEEKPLELEKMTFEAPAMTATTPEFSNIAGEVANVTNNVTVGDVQQTTVGEIGDLFAEGGGAMGDGGASQEGAEFFGVKASGRVFTFVVDSSKSMNGGKFDAARAELFAAVSRLQPEQRFYVIFFDHDAYRMFDLKNPEPYPIPATSKNIYRLGTWLPTVELELRTDAYEAIKYAVEMLPDAIYILSDGQFTDQRQVDTYLREHNIIEDIVDGKQPKVVIHTIGFYDRAGEKNLNRLANEYGGTYRFVPNPKDVRKK